MHRRPLSAAVMAATLTVAGCSGTGSVNDTYNAADLRYATGVITAHQRTLALADLARNKTSDPEVLEVIDVTDKEARAEITMVTGYIRAWGQTPDLGSEAHAAEADEPLLRGQEELSTLAALSGQQFDRAVMATTAAHNRDYVTDAERQLKRGYDKVMLELARSIATERRLASPDLESTTAP